MSWWHNNEDAGDLSAYNEAEYYAEMELERQYQRHERYVEQWDLDMRPPVVQSGGGWVQAEGPKPLPICEMCEMPLAREHDGYVGSYGELYCSEECRDEGESCGSYTEGREFPTYG